MSRSFKTITKKEDIDYILSLNEDTLTESVFHELFADFGKGPRFNPYDAIRIPPKTYGRPGKMNLESIQLLDVGYLIDTLLKEIC